MSELDILKIVLERLNMLNIGYMLTGSVALNYYAQPRMTRDIDIVINIVKEDVTKIYSLFKEDFYIDKESVEDSIREKSSFNIIYFDFPMKFDFIVRKDTPYRLLEFDRRRKIEIEGVTAFIVSLEDLILSKLYWARDSHSQMQLDDVRLLLSGKNIDLKYIEDKAQELSLASLLKELK
ncbi:MAG: hypothetical protein ABH843_06120 [Candidatus Omnitrophota bacterium]